MGHGQSSTVNAAEMAHGAADGLELPNSSAQTPARGKKCSQLLPKKALSAKEEGLSLNFGKRAFFRSSSSFGLLVLFTLLRDGPSATMNGGGKKSVVIAIPIAIEVGKIRIMNNNNNNTNDARRRRRRRSLWGSRRRGPRGEEEGEEEEETLLP
jgi:hypothetical protein